MQGKGTPLFGLEVCCNIEWCEKLHLCLCASNSGRMLRKASSRVDEKAKQRFCVNLSYVGKIGLVFWAFLSDEAEPSVF